MVAFFGIIVFIGFVIMGTQLILDALKDLKELRKKHVKLEPELFPRRQWQKQKDTKILNEAREAVSKEFTWDHDNVRCNRDIKKTDLNDIKNSANDYLRSR